ncbi:MAG: hypothetical protein LH619_04325 [Chitinophagaceae bacterium]|nr:hypothetical protein [Chitinophagaceae bacterium]
MKRMQLLSVVLIIMVAATVTSCKPSRVWATKDKKEKKDRVDERYTPPPPPSRSYVSASLVISPTPGFVMNRYSDGRYYHRSPNGFLYWKGYDNRFFLDRSYLNRVRYSEGEYEQWKRYSRG